MARTNPELERLQRENEHLKERLKNLTAEPPDIPFTACDNSCVVARPQGMQTNGGCRCSERTLRLAVQYYRQVAQQRQVLIIMMRTGEWLLEMEEEQPPLETLRTLCPKCKNEMGQHIVVMGEQGVRCPPIAEKG